jgi:hypothetical protein
MPFGYLRHCAAAGAVGLANRKVAISAMRSASSTRESNPSSPRAPEKLAVDAAHTEVFDIEECLDARISKPLRPMPLSFSVLPGLVVEEHHVLLDGLAADVQLIGGEVWVGIADCQTAQDR